MTSILAKSIILLKILLVGLYVCTVIVLESNNSDIELSFMIFNMVRMMAVHGLPSQHWRSLQNQTLLTLHVGPPWPLVFGVLRFRWVAMAIKHIC